MSRQLAPLVSELRGARIARGLRQLDVSERSGYPLNTISLWERGLRIPSTRALVDWASSLGMDVQLVERK